MQSPYLTVPQKLGMVSKTMQQLNVTVSVYLYLFHVLVPPSEMLSRFESIIVVIFLAFLDFTFHQIFIHNSIELYFFASYFVNSFGFSKIFGGLARVRMIQMGCTLYSRDLHLIHPFQIKIVLVGTHKTFLNVMTTKELSTA